MILTAIAAMSANRVIGKDGGLPWSIPEDFKFFKDKTTGHIMIMGRKTYDSLPNGPLPKRLHIVITRAEPASLNYPEGVIVVASIEAALAYLTHNESNLKAKWGDEAFIIGGGEIYRAMLPYTNKIYLTEIHQDIEGDTHFPPFSSSEFRETERLHRSGSPSFDFVTYERNNSTSA